MAHHWSLGYNNSPQVSWTLLRILPDLTSTVVSTASILLLISNLTSLLSKLLLVVSSSLLSIGITSYSCSPTFCFLLFSLCCPPERQNSQVVLFLLINTTTGRLARIGWSVCISKSERILGISFSWTNSGFCVYHLSGWSSFNLLPNS